MLIYVLKAHIKKLKKKKLCIKKYNILTFKKLNVQLLRHIFL